MAKKKSTMDVGAVYSMTGFGNAVQRTKTLDLRVEVRSVNHRFLKLNFKLPEIFTAREEEINQMVSAMQTRGAVNLYVFSEALSGTPPQIFDQDSAIREWKIWSAFAKKVKSGETPTMAMIATLPNVYRDGVIQLNEEEAWKLLQNTLNEALIALRESRAKEGRYTADELLSRCKNIHEKVNKIAELAPRQATAHRQKMLQRINEVMKTSGMQISEQDILRETAIYADRSDINEELSRLRSHLDRFQSKIVAGGSIGKELEFLIQELHREINTVGSKSGEYEISALVVEVKSELEKMREQTQNIE